MLRLAILADDLTGALDSCVAFAEAGLHGAVFPSLDAVSTASFAGFDVVALNVDSRQMAPEEAAQAAARAWQIIAPWNAECLFKKVDSRMKGNIAAELAAIMGLSGRTRAIVSPAIPSMGRFTSGGMVTGFGIESPLPIAELAGWQAEWEVRDCGDMAEMARIADEAIGDCKTAIAVGASGLAEAMAHALAPGETKRAQAGHRTTLPGDARMLMVIGSRDPITLGQIPALSKSEIPYLEIVGDAPLPHSAASADLILLRPDAAEREPAAVANDLAAAALRISEEQDISALLLSGGDTAAAFVRQAGIDLLVPRCSLAPGMPLATGNANGRDYTLITKSGGFGSPRALGEAHGAWRQLHRPGR